MSNKISGEQSNLRISVSNGFNQSYKDSYVIDNTEVNYSLCRQIYLNTHENYKLGGGFAKPIVNNLSSFMGIPQFISNDIIAQEIINKYLVNIKSVYNKIHRNILREGDCYLLVTNEKKNDKLFKNELIISFKTLLPERLQVLKDETGNIVKVIVSTSFDYIDKDTDEKVKYKVKEVWTNEVYQKIYDKINVPNYISEHLIDMTMPNPYQFIPIIWFKNEEEEFRNNGTSELESVEPLLRAYHDVMLDSLRSTKLNSSPKLRIKIENLQQFLNNNFTDEEIATGKLKLAKKDVIFIGKEDDLGYVEVSGNTHTTLLEFIFLCIIDTSETPEFMFGSAVASSKASVSEQMIPFMKKVNRKRDSISDNYKLLARMVFSIYNDNNSTNLINDFETDLFWQDVDNDEDNLKSNTINTLITALSLGIESKLLSFESAINYLKQYINTMNNYDEEKEKILEQYDSMDTSLESQLQKQIDEIKNNQNDNDNIDEEDNNQNIDEEEE